MKRLLTGLLAMSLVAIACGDSAGDDTTTTTTAVTTTTAATTTTADTTTTTVGETTTTTEAIETTPYVPGEDPERDEIAERFTIVFDGESDFATRAPFIEDATGLESTIEAYLAAGAAVGGLGVEVTEIGISGDTAVVVYSLLFAGNPAYTDIDTEMMLTADGWVVTRDVFCAFMGSARVGCP